VYWLYIKKVLSKCPKSRMGERHARMNGEFGSGIGQSVVKYLTGYQLSLEQVELFGRFARKQIILKRSFAVNGGEMIQVEISREFRLEEFIRYAGRFGPDERGWSAQFSLRRSAEVGIPKYSRFGETEIP
jgi:hypothetical protein